MPRMMIASVRAPTMSEVIVAAASRISRGFRSWRPRIASGWAPWLRMAFGPNRLSLMAASASSEPGRGAVQPGDCVGGRHAGGFDEGDAGKRGR